MPNRWAQDYIAIVQAGFLLVAAAGAILALKAGSPIVPLLAALAYLNLMHAATFATLRYSLPLTPLLMLLATYATVRMGGVLAGRFGFDSLAVQLATSSGNRADEPARKALSQ